MREPSLWRSALTWYSCYLAADYADLIAKRPVAGFPPKAELSSATIRRVLGTG
jgi:hypothetical protein